MTRSLSEIEVWKPIPGYEGLYEASSKGQIRTVDGKITSSSLYPRRVWKQRILKQKWTCRKGKNGKKDARVSLWKDGVEKTYLVARLIAMAFLPAPFDKLTVNHINGDTTNNDISNLEWVSMAENNRLGFQTGLFKANQKSVVLTQNDDTELSFKSMAEADRFMGRCSGYTSAKIARSNYCYGKDGTRYWARLSDGGDSAS